MSGVLHGVLASLKAAAAAVTDAYFKYVSLLLNTTSTNGAQNNTFLDASTNNFTITRNGNTTQGSFTPYMPNGYWGAYFDGTGDYLTVADNAALQMSTGDFTIEFWWNPSSISGFQTIAEKGYTAAGGLLFQTGSGNGTIVVYAAGSAVITASSGSVVGTWDHYALVRSGTTLTLYRNGTSVGSATNSTNFNSTASLFVGGSTGGGGYYVNGYLSNLRIVKGTAVYTANFTPPTTPLTAITNTSLLACQSNRFIDNSTNAFAITVNGDSRISKFSPFNPPASYDTATYGGSGYFDGSGDYLTTASSTSEAGNFTIESWVYRTAASTAIVVSYGSEAANRVYMYVDSTNQLGWGVYLVADYTLGGSVLPNVWNHIAIVRSGTTVTGYVNGTALATTTTYAGTTGNTGGFGIGANRTGGTPYTGYISNARVVQGTAVYTANFTPPSTPLTAITNTSLLLNFTNGGIYDATTINDLETSGSAQVSTTQAKFGTTSAKFAGGSDWMQMVNNPSLRFGTAPFTIEAWLYPTSTSSMCVVSVYTGSSGWTWKISGNVIAWYDNTSGNIGGTASVASNTWTHVAIVREGTGTNQFKFYVNGVLDVTSTCSANFTQTANCFVGGEGTATPNFATNVWNGYIDELRITNGYARYTSNFTPPTAAFPTQ